MCRVCGARCWILEVAGCSVGSGSGHFPPTLRRTHSRFPLRPYARNDFRRFPPTHVIAGRTRRDADLRRPRLLDCCIWEAARVHVASASPPYFFVAGNSDDRPGTFQDLSVFGGVALTDGVFVG